MTLNVTQNGVTRIYTDVELVEEAFRSLGVEPRDLDPGFIPHWLKEGKSLVEILAIAGFTADECREVRVA